MCFNLNCSEECDYIKKATCLDRMTREQYELKVQIRGCKVCSKCGAAMVKARYRGKGIRLCTKCGGMICEKEEKLDHRRRKVS